MASSRYLGLLNDMAALHIAKSAGYAGQDNPDPWANFRKATEFGVSPEVGCLIRLSDKVSRLAALTRNPNNEQVGEAIEDTAIDAAAYSLIYVCLRRERTDGPDQPAKISEEVILGQHFGPPAPEPAQIAMDQLLNIAISANTLVERITHDGTASDVVFDGLRTALRDAGFTAGRG